MGTRRRVVSVEGRGAWETYGAIPTTRLAPELPLVHRPSIDRPRFSPCSQPELPRVYVLLHDEYAHCQGVNVTSLQAKVR